jgi:alpha-beta hydrolase superfamily lysophospholipase
MCGESSVRGTEHWTTKGEVRLFLWRKAAPEASPAPGTVLFVHGSSMASQPTFDLHVPGRPHSSVMDWFAARGFDTWCLDNEGYGRSDKRRAINCDISNGADDLDARVERIEYDPRHVPSHHGAFICDLLAQPPLARLA